MKTTVNNIASKNVTSFVINEDMLNEKKAMKYISKPNMVAAINDICAAIKGLNSLFSPQEYTEANSKKELFDAYHRFYIIYTDLKDIEVEARHRAEEKTEREERARQAEINKNVEKFIKPATPLKKEGKAKEEATKAVSAVALSPIMKKFLDLKSKYPDAFLLFRTGDFYETYQQDAEKASKILGITLTKSTNQKGSDGNAVKMASFPCHALDIYLPKLIRAGKRVAIYDSFEAPGQTAKRGISKLVFPGDASEKVEKKTSGRVGDANERLTKYSEELTEKEALVANAEEFAKLSKEDAKTIKHRIASLKRKIERANKALGTK